MKRYHDQYCKMKGIETSFQLYYEMEQAREGED